MPCLTVNYGQLVRTSLKLRATGIRIDGDVTGIHGNRVSTRSVSSKVDSPEACAPRISLVLQQLNSLIFSE